ncbi:MAG: DNA alkylation repair protein [Pseudomonadota bacterium]
MTPTDRVARDLGAALNEAFTQRGDPMRAEQQQAYMKSSMPFAGLAMPELRQTCKALIRLHPIDTSAQWQAAVLHLWHSAQVREQRHAALLLLAHRPYQRQWLQPDLLALARTLIVDGAWWDFVDPLATNHVGLLLEKFPEPIRPQVLAWTTDADVWVRRSSILCQLKFKAATDTELLHAAIQGSIQDNDFFARKAIGWALREYAKTDAPWVISYVDTHAASLSALSQREALRVLRKQGRVV